MKLFSKGLLLALLHVVLVCTLGTKLLYDRAYRPHVWIKVATYDPDLPIRGRYLSLNLEVPAEGFAVSFQPSPYLKDKDGKPLIQDYPVPNRGDLVLRDGQVVGVANQSGEYWVNVRRRDDGLVTIFRAEATYFLPEHGVDPSHLKVGEELWIDATIPRKGPPRPIRLGIKKDGILTPLQR